MADQANAQQQEAPHPWTVPSSAKLSQDELRLRSAGVTNALATVERIQSRIPSWQRFAASAAKDANNTPPDWQSIARRFAADTNHPEESLDGNTPREMLNTIAGRDKEAKLQGKRLTFGALLGATLGYAWSAMWPGVPIGFFALLGAGAVLSATTQGPISAVVLMLELTGRDRSFILPLILIAALSTLIARSIELRSIYDARLSDEQIESRQKMREQEPNEIGIPQ